ncbi:MAG TPA: tRNA-dihydrouridine synthase [Candidatus Paceibacterota bacterium]
MNFWEKLKKDKVAKGRPIMALAPMANVTDMAFRRIVAKYGKPDVMWTEFVSADGLMSSGRDIILRDLAYSSSERPIAAQLFTGHPDKMFQAGKLVAELGFDGLDINMGCPDRAVEKQGGGAFMIKDKKNALAVLESARRGVMEGKISNSKNSDNRQLSKENIPISVKTRVGYNKNEIDEWIGFLLEQKLSALTVHLRTRKEMSNVPAHWELMLKIVSLRDKISPETLILGNGDISSIKEAEVKAKETGCDGIMIGRGIFGNPWFFSGRTFEIYQDGLKNSSQKSTSDISRNERLKVMVEHTKLFEKFLVDIKSFAIMKKHFKAYVSGWEGAKELRIKLMETKNAKEVDDVVKDYINI